MCTNIRRQLKWNEWIILTKFFTIYYIHHLLKVAGNEKKNWRRVMNDEKKTFGGLLEKGRWKER